MLQEFAPLAQGFSGGNRLIDSRAFEAYWFVGRHAASAATRRIHHQSAGVKCYRPARKREPINPPGEVTLCAAK
jgi:hypothetical protein